MNGWHKKKMEDVLTKPSVRLARARARSERLKRKLEGQELEFFLKPNSSPLD